MIRHSFSHRFVSLLSGVSFALLSLLTNVERPCAMHSMGGSDAMSMVEGDHGAHHAPMAPESAPDHQCKCSTLCCGTPTMAMLAETPDLASMATVRASIATPLPLSITLFGVREHALPFAIGPPHVMRG